MLGRALAGAGNDVTFGSRAPASDGVAGSTGQPAVEAVVSGVGLRPVYVGEDQEDLIGALFQLWVVLAMKQGRGRRLALKLLEG